MQSSSQIITTNKSTPSFFTGRMPFLSPNQQCQSTEGKLTVYDKLDKLVPWILLKLRMTEVVVTTGVVRYAKAPVKSSPPTNHHAAFYRPDAVPVAQPTVSKH